MKAARNLFIGVILGAVIGWSLGFLRFPYIEKNSSFLLGFIACLAFVSLTLILLFIWKKNSLLVRLISKSPTTQNSNNATRTYSVIWILISAFIVFGGLISSFLIYRQNELFETKTQDQKKRIQEQSELIESVRRSSLNILMNDILDKVDDDLKNNPGGKLSDKTIASIVAAFNYTFIPYRYWEGDNLSEKKLSPEKGQFLLALCTKNIDSSSFNKIKLNAHFFGADLRKGDLRRVDLSGADLKDADLSGADLSGAILKGADLRKANLRGAHVNKANLVGADLRRAVLSWAELNGAQLDSANLNGADLTNAQLRKADLRKATFRAAKLDGALLNEANMEGVVLIDVSMKKVNLTRADLTKADVNRANFNEAIMTETELTELLNVDKDWFEKLNGWHITGAKEIQEHYKIVVYTVIENISWYRLEKI
jgi:uncharacterized protein YjbI with pentapeptide repeats